MSENSPIFFEFDEERDAYMALDTLQELGYQPSLMEGEEKPTLHVHVDRQDLTSALEIAQAHGGRLVERADSLTEEGAFGMAYGLDDGIRIPAHVVNEDFPEEYSHPSETAEASFPDRDGLAARAFDPSEDSYDGFSAGIRL